MSLHILMIAEITDICYWYFKLSAFLPEIDKKNPNWGWFVFGCNAV